MGISALTLRWITCCGHQSLAHRLRITRTSLVRARAGLTVPLWFGILRLGDDLFWGEQPLWMPRSAPPQSSKLQRPNCHPACMPTHPHVLHALHGAHTTRTQMCTHAHTHTHTHTRAPSLAHACEHRYARFLRALLAGELFTPRPLRWSAVRNPWDPKQQTLSLDCGAVATITIVILKIGFAAFFFAAAAVPVMRPCCRHRSTVGFLAPTKQLPKNHNTRCCRA